MNWIAADSLQGRNASIGVILCIPDSNLAYDVHDYAVKCPADCLNARPSSGTPNGAFPLSHRREGTILNIFIYDSV